MLNGSQTNDRLLVLIVMLTFWWPCASAYKLQAIEINPNIRCPGKNEENIWRHCDYGGYIENPDPKNCADRYVCYKGLNQLCRPRLDKCADNAICTECGICEKCEHPDSCSDFKLCPSATGYAALNFITRLLQPRQIDYNEE